MALDLFIRAYAELNDFLPPGRRGRTFTHPYLSRRTVKDLLESLGLPHPEIGMILVDGEPVGFDHLVQPGERISVFPPFRTLDIPRAAVLTPALEGRPQFVLDTHLGQLAHYLRMLGFDTAYANDATDRVLARRSARQGRVLLTRDRDLLKRGRVEHGYYVRSTRPRHQLVEVVRRYELLSRMSPFSRCLDCNGELRLAEPAEIDSSVPPDAREAYERFRGCENCGKVYWAGSHVEAMEGLIAWLKERVAGTGDP